MIIKDYKSGSGCDVISKQFTILKSTVYNIILKFKREKTCK